MGSKVLLLSTNRCTAPDPVFPLGLSHLNAALRHTGHETCWVDYNMDDRSLQDVLREFRPDFVGVSLRNIDDVLIRKQETYFGAVSGIGNAIRAVVPCTVVLGGSGFSIFPRPLMEASGADYGIQGEGESGFLALISALKGGREVAAIPGLGYRRGGEIVTNPQRASSPDLPLEFVDRPSPVVTHYLRKGGMLNLQSQRGCAHGCCYCTYPVIEGRAHRRRPPEAVAAEMLQLQSHGAKYVFIVDSIFNSSPRHIVETCEAILRKKVAIRWSCFLRPQGLTRELVQLMARAGLTHIEFGSDSFCDEVLEAYGKKFSFDDVLESSELARKEGLDYCHFLICGGPGENLTTLQTGFRNSHRLSGAVILAVVGMRIYPGTALHERALSEGLLDVGTDLLSPVYYLAPGLTKEAIFGQLRDFALRSPNWIVGDPAPDYTRLVERLREKGVAGPLWSYLAMLQRIMPPPPVLAVR